MGNYGNILDHSIPAWFDVCLTHLKSVHPVTRKKYIALCCCHRIMIENAVKVNSTCLWGDAVDSYEGH